MKLIVTVLLLASTASASVYLPKTNSGAMYASPMSDGEVSWTESGSSASLYVGNGSTIPRRVVDPTALRGFREKLIPLSELAVVWPSGWSMVSNRLICSSLASTNIITVCASDSIEISRLDWSHNYQQTSTQAVGSSPGIRVRTNHNKAVITVTKSDDVPAGTMTITISGAIYLTPGDEMLVNDATTTTWKIRDSVGVFNLATMRYDLLHHYDGNRGEDWASYPATQSVAMDGHPCYWDTSRNITASATSNLVFSIRGTPALRLTDAVPDSTGWVSNTSFTVTSNQCVIGYRANVTGFDAKELRVQYRHQLDKGEWEWVLADDVTITPTTSTTGTITVRSAMRDTGFFRMWYGGLMSAAMRVKVELPLQVEKSLLMRGTDDILYRITVNAGTITATAVPGE